MGFGRASLDIILSVYCTVRRGCKETGNIRKRLGFKVLLS